MTSEKAGLRGAARRSDARPTGSEKTVAAETVPGGTDRHLPDDPGVETDRGGSSPARSAATEPVEPVSPRGATGVEVPEPSASPRYLGGARRDRGEETRSQLIHAGLDIFGRYGFEGSSTRQIASEAGVNLAAIVYHFGGKEALYLAVAEHIAGNIVTRMRPARPEQTLPENAPEARAMFVRIIETLADILLGSAEAERWARFILREQLQPTAAFDVIYRFMGGTIDTVTKLAAVALARQDDEELRVRVFTMIGQVLVFRVANAMVLRRMRWDAIGDRERALIKRIVVEHAHAILDAAAVR